MKTRSYREQTKKLDHRGFVNAPAMIAAVSSLSKRTCIDQCSLRNEARKSERSVLLMLSLGFLCVCSACKTTHFEYTKDGVSVRATDTRFLMRSNAKITVEPQTNNYP